LWLRPGEMAPESAFRGAPEPVLQRPFGRAPPGAAHGAGAGALLNRPEIDEPLRQPVCFVRFRGRRVQRRRES
jgi:hypothetical protein